MIIINISEAKAKLGQYLEQVRAGERVVLCQRNRPVAEIRGLPEALVEGPVQLGVLKDQFEVPDDFGSPLPDFEADYYGETE
jgi:prevent-host-death family protein